MKKRVNEKDDEDKEESDSDEETSDDAKGKGRKDKGKDKKDKKNRRENKAVIERKEKKESKEDSEKDDKRKKNINSKKEKEKAKKKNEKEKEKAKDKDRDKDLDLQHKQKVQPETKEVVKKEEESDVNKEKSKEDEDREKKRATVTEKEKTKDVTDYAGSANKNKDKIHDESILDDAGEKISDDSDRMLTVKDLVEMMSIMMVSQKRLGNPNVVGTGEFSSIDMMAPAICEGLGPEFDLKYDSLAKWCVFQGRIRTIEPFIDYESFLKNYIALLHDTVSEFYRYFRISERVNLQSLRVIPPELFGSYEKWSEIQKTDVIQSYYAHVELFLPHKLNNGYNHRICLNPCLQNFCAETQRFLCQGEPGYNIRLWIDRFVQKKQNKLLLI